MSWDCEVCGKEKCTSISRIDGKQHCSSCKSKTTPPETQIHCPCGEVDSISHWTPGTLSLERGWCFNCEFWERHIKEHDAGTAIIDGHRYHFDVSLPIKTARHQDSLGHAGRAFTIVFADGRQVTTNNLWAQGKIPERFRDRLPDNATFERREKK